MNRVKENRHKRVYTNDTIYKSFKYRKNSLY